MIVEIKGHKYEVDFDDLRTLESVDSVAKELDAGALASNEGGLSDMRRQMEVAKTFIDRIVGEGVSDECFGDSQNYMDVMRAMFSLIRTSKEKAYSMADELNELVASVSTPSAERKDLTFVQENITASTPVRKPVRVE